MQCTKGDIRRWTMVIFASVGIARVFETLPAALGQIFSPSTSLNNLDPAARRDRIAFLLHRDRFTCQEDRSEVSSFLLTQTYTITGWFLEIRIQ